MTYQTNWLPAARNAMNATHFLINSLLFHSAYLAVRMFRLKRRSADAVQKNYDVERSEQMARIQGIDWDEYVFFSAELNDFIEIGRAHVRIPVPNAHLGLR